ncbi:MAG TPA: hypothetical protein VGJ60_07290 [Chloroflexota bacterium]|jgi:hypothetical protein
MADIKIQIDRSDPDAPGVIISALPGTDSATYELAKPKIQAVLEALGIAGVRFSPLTDIEQHVHGEQTLVVDQMNLRQR